MPGSPPEPDADLIRRWQRGDRAAFEAIVRHWGPRVGRFLVRLTANPDLAADLAQETFLRVYLEAGRYRDTGRFSTWLFQIALNLARDAGRRSARRTVVPLPTTGLTANGQSVEQTAEQSEEARAVTAALAELSPPLREVVVLRCYEQMSFEEMGRMLETPSTTLKSRFALALRQLQKRLILQGHSPEADHEDV
jgi:RNA polymerase sigma-70 factor (ECF subfamily)